MANTTFDGPVRSKNGFQSIGPGAVVALTAATNLTVADHAGRILTMDPVGTPTAITLPTINATADSAVAMIVGSVIAVGVPTGSIVTILPAWSATVKSVAAVRAITEPGPID